MPVRHIGKLEFYITNVCNLTCTHCNRFNNYDFKGWQRWNDYSADYAKWAEYITVDGIVLLGGEPLLNPSIKEWVHGLNSIFGKSVQILTNGTRLNHVPGLYECINEFNRHLTFDRNWIGISVHNASELEFYKAEAEKFLRGEIKTYHGKGTLDHTGHPVTFGADYTYVDENGIAVRLWLQDSFYTSALRQGPTTWDDNGNPIPGKYQVFDNDPIKAHAACGFVQWKNYHMIRGKLYKCGPSVLFSEFDQQHPLDISEEDRNILNSYVPLSPWDYEEKGEDFFKNLDNPIPQCKFCPVAEQLQNTTIAATLKKAGSTGTLS